MTPIDPQKCAPRTPKGGVSKVEQMQPAWHPAGSKVSRVAIIHPLAVFMEGWEQPFFPARKPDKEFSAILFTKFETDTRFLLRPMSAVLAVDFFIIKNNQQANLFERRLAH